MADQTDIRLGVIGGLGPMATAYFLERITQMTDAKSDQEHLEMIICSVPAIPDRTRFILGQSQDSPVPMLISVGRRLSELQVCCLAIPCITDHYFHRELSEAIDRPIIHAIRETALQLRQQGVRTAGIAATDGTLAGRLFQDELDRQGIRSIVPCAMSQQVLMSLIYDDIKAGRSINLSRFTAVMDELRQQGAEIVLLGCTELSLIKRDYRLGPGFLDVLDVLARAAILACGYPLKPEYDCLITKAGITHAK